MQLIKIQIPEHDGRVKSLVEMARRGRIICLPDVVFCCTRAGIGVLDLLNVVYKELGRGGFDYSDKTLRDSLAA